MSNTQYMSGLILQYIVQLYTFDFLSTLFVYLKKYSNGSKSEQAPGSEFHPRDKSEKVDYDFLGPFWDEKVNPKT